MSFSLYHPFESKQRSPCLGTERWLSLATFQADDQSSKDVLGPNGTTSFFSVHLFKTTVLASKFPLLFPLHDLDSLFCPVKTI
jgi:hypothetical protein